MGYRPAQASILVISVIAALVCCLPRSAQACSTPVVHKLVGLPSDGATSVPTDVQPTISLLDLDSTGLADVEITLTSESGDEVAFRLEAPYVWDGVIVPDEPLTAQTTYTLAASVRTKEGTVLLSSEFRTGEGKLATKPAPPRTELQHYAISSGELSSCGPPPSGTCVPLAADEVVEVTLIDGLGQRDEPYLYRGAFFTNLSGVDQNTSFTCVELKTRALNGALSEPTVLCGEDFALQRYTGEGSLDCTDSGLVTTLKPEAKSALLCSVSWEQPARMSVSLLALALIAVGYALRRRRDLHAARKSRAM